MTPDLLLFTVTGLADPTRAHARFRLATSAGNEAFSEGAHERARGHFEDALALARRLFQRAAEGKTCPEGAAAALLLAHFNAAQNLSRLGCLEQAGQHLESACRMLSDWRFSPHAPTKLRQACEGLLPSALNTCLAHLERCGASSERILALYERAARQSSPCSTRPNAIRTATADRCKTRL